MNIESGRQCLNAYSVVVVKSLETFWCHPVWWTSDRQRCGVFIIVTETYRNMGTSGRVRGQRLPGGGRNGAEAKVIQEGRNYYVSKTCWVNHLCSITACVRMYAGNKTNNCVCWKQDKLILLDYAFWIFFNFCPNNSTGGGNYFQSSVPHAPRG